MVARLTWAIRAQNAMLSFSDEYSFSRSSCHHYYFERCNLKSNNIHLAWHGSGLDKNGLEMARFPLSLMRITTGYMANSHEICVSGHVCVWCASVCCYMNSFPYTHAHTIHTLLEWMATFGHLQCAHNMNHVLQCIFGMSVGKSQATYTGQATLLQWPKASRLILWFSHLFNNVDASMVCLVPLTRANVSSGSNSVNLLRLRLFTCSSTKLKCSSALKHNLSRSDITTS